MITFKHSGSFKYAEAFLTKSQTMQFQRILHQYGQEGVAALMSATPEDSGKTAHAWSYKITDTNSSFSLSFENANEVDRVPIVILLQYGHGTKNGGYVVGMDFINPAIQPIFDALADAMWKEVTNL